MEESAFGLSAEELKQIKYIEPLKHSHKHRSNASKSKKSSSSNQRLPCRFSTQLSKEAQLAMRLAREDARRTREHETFQHYQHHKHNHQQQQETQPNQTQRGLAALPEVPSSEFAVSMTTSSVYSSAKTPLSQNGKRMCRPETSISSSSSSTASFTELYKRLQSARMSKDITDETYDEEKDRKRALGGGKVESAMELVVLVNHDDDDSDDTRVIEELAITNSVDKCMVWMEATETGLFEDEQREIC